MLLRVKSWENPVLVILSDGGANVTKSGVGGRSKAFEESLKSAELFNSHTIKSIFIDIADNPALKLDFWLISLGLLIFLYQS